MVDELISPEDLSRFIPLIERSPYKAQRFLASPRVDLLKLTLGAIEEALSAPESFAAVVREGQEIRAAAIVAPLPWDSQILEKRMSAIKVFVADDLEAASRVVNQVCAQARSQSMDFLMCRVYADDRVSCEALASGGFRPVETTREYVYDCTAPPTQVPRHNEVTIRRARSTDLADLVSLSRIAFENFVGRFHSDPMVSAEAALKVYEEWVRSSLGGYADVVFLAEAGDETVGFGAWKNPSARELEAGLRCAHYLIAAVAPHVRGRGIYGALARAGMRLYCKTSDVIDGPTNSKNIAVHRALEKLGWSARDSRITHHAWFDAKRERKVAHAGDQNG